MVAKTVDVDDTVFSTAFAAALANCNTSLPAQTSSIIPFPKKHYVRRDGRVRILIFHNLSFFPQKTATHNYGQQLIKRNILRDLMDFRSFETIRISLKDRRGKKGRIKTSSLFQNMH